MAFNKFILFLSIIVYGSSCKGKSEQKPHPNLLIIFADQMRGQAMGFTGEEPVKTPHLDQLASESLVLTEAVANYPVCSPFRGMLMTGQYPHSNGVLANSNSASAEYGYALQPEDITWSDILHQQGYSLGFIGKWHLSNPRKPYVESYNNEGEVKWNAWTSPENRHGFDFWYAYNTYDRHLNPMYWQTNTPRNQPFKVDQWGPAHEADQAIAYIKNKGGQYRKGDQPFGLVVAMNPPHSPYDQVPEKYLNLYKDTPLTRLTNRPNIPSADHKWGKYYRENIRQYYAMITGVDQQIQRILEALKEQGLENNTIVLFTSDHGNCLGIHDERSKNNPYEESMRIPFLIRWPDKIKPRKDNLLISTPDIFPTLLDLMGYAENIPEQVDGKSRASVFLKNNGPRPDSQLYMRVPRGSPGQGLRGVRTHRYTYVMQSENGTAESLMLFDNQQDPYQQDNLVDQNPEIKDQLQADLKNWLQKTEDPWIKNLKHE